MNINIDLNDLRKLIFANSQYCNWYNVGNNTIVAGIMRNEGYLYQKRLSDEQLKDFGKEYRKYTTIMNWLVAVEIVAYIYLVIFPYFVEFMKQPYLVSVLALTLIPLVLLYLTYVVVNNFFIKSVFKMFGPCKKTLFRPTIKNIDEKAFEEYNSTPRKSIYVVLLLVLLFAGYVLTPYTIVNLSHAEKYNSVINLSNVYSKIVPISPEVYAQRAYAKFKLKRYKEAVVDYELANKYSLSDSFLDDIVGVKTYYLPYDEMLQVFDRAISEETIEGAKYLLRYEKAIYQLKNKDYKPALAELNTLISAYNQKKSVFFSPADAYYNRSVIRAINGDLKGAGADRTVAKKLCPECKFSQETTLVMKL